MRHNIRNHSLQPGTALSVGNGSAAITVDVTGLQTLPQHYPVGARPGETEGSHLSTMSHWGWHSTPNPLGATTADSHQVYDSPRGPVTYVDMREGFGEDHSEPGGKLGWLRGNPHRLDLGHLRLAHCGRTITAEEISNIDQELDLLSGIITSRFHAPAHASAPAPTTVLTAADPEHDLFAFDFDSPTELLLEFPYGTTDWGNAANWDAPQAHTTTLEQLSATTWRIRRILDTTTYFTFIYAPAGSTVVHTAAHQISITAPRVVLGYSPTPELLPELSPAQIRERSSSHWAKFWEQGGAMDFSASTHEDSFELERRIVLSQYLTAIHSAGSLPPAETGLMTNSWRGKFHLEMHYWHAAHFPLWGRGYLLERSMNWYVESLPAARQIARDQNFAGARWPKQIGPNIEETPSGVAPFLIWQQPHPIVLAELLYREDPRPEVLHRFAEVVFETAEFMADFPVATGRGYELCEPLIPAQECYAHVRDSVRNPTFELAQWRWGLRLAATWFDRLGKPVSVKWREVAAGLVAPHQIDGKYQAISTPPYLIRRDHPSMLGALGVVPPVGMIDPQVMAATLDDVYSEWDWERTWGWDYPMIAMTAARLGRPQDALNALLQGGVKNLYLPNGHNYQRPTLPIYLPGNGGLLLAAAMLTAGWDGYRGEPMINQVSGWNVQFEGLRPYL